MKIYQVDAFTEKAFGGNPAAVCILDEECPDEWHQDVAREMSLSETAFLLQRDQAFSLRWFTPACEVSLCGHATLASAHVLWEQGILDVSEGARFDTKSGRLAASLIDDFIEMDFPSRPVQLAVAPDGLLTALGVEAIHVARWNRLWLIEVADDREITRTRPDFVALQEVDEVTAVMITAASSTEYDFVSRFFAPAVGIDEDPVTGSAHCSLTPYWSERLDKTTLAAYQASERGGAVRCRLGTPDRIVLGGRAVTVMEGRLLA